MESENASAVRILCRGSLAQAFLLPRSGGRCPRPQKVQWSLSRAVSLEGSPSIATGSARSAAASPSGPLDAAAEVTAGLGAFAVGRRRPLLLFRVLAFSRLQLALL